MRLWHYELIGVLPRKQLIAQWRECCCIARNIAKNGTPNHLLVNPVMAYPVDNFLQYCEMVIDEMERREYVVSTKSREKLFLDLDKSKHCFDNNSNKIGLFVGWHNKRYLKQCFYNLQEKYDCGGIDYYEYNLIIEEMIGLGVDEVFTD